MFCHLYLIFTSTSSKVNLGLKSKYCEEQWDTSSDAHCNEDSVDTVVGGDGTHHEALTQGEDQQQDQVQRWLSPGTLKTSQGYQGDHHQGYGNIVNPSVGLYKP